MNKSGVRVLKRTQCINDYSLATSHPPKPLPFHSWQRRIVQSECV
jgi:hypothetical protein